MVKIDPPGGPRWQTAGNATWNRGKRSITLDLKTRPTSRARDASSPAPTCWSRTSAPRDGPPRPRRGRDDRGQPALIYCSLPGFAADDPRAGVAAWEGVLGAAGPRPTRRRATASPPPTTPCSRQCRSPPPTARSSASSRFAMALNARERDGAGQRIEVPLFDATFTADRVARPLRARPLDALAGARRRLGAPVRVQRRALGPVPRRQPALHRALHRLAAWRVREEGLHVSEEVAQDPDLSAELLRRMTALFKDAHGEGVGRPRQRRPCLLLDRLRVQRVDAA